MDIHLTVERTVQKRGKHPHQIVIFGLGGAESKNSGIIIQIDHVLNRLVAITGPASHLSKPDGFYLPSG